MHRSLVAGLSVVGMAVVAQNARAQTCLGTAAFSSRHVQVGGDFSSTSATKTVTPHVAIGAPTGTFAAVDFSSASLRGLDDRSNALGALVGYQLNAGGPSSVQFCPFLGLRHAFPLGPANFSGNTLSAGGFVGTQQETSHGFAFAPSVGGIFSRSQTSVNDLRPGASGRVSGVRTFTQVGLNFGFVFSRRYTLRPTLLLPVSTRAPQITWGMSASTLF